MRYALCVMRIIIGLGNPGKKYERTRHNFGFMALNFIAQKLDLSWNNNKKFKALITDKTEAEIEFPEEEKISGEIILIKPQTFMNNSGQSAQAVLSYYKLLPRKLGLLKIKNSDLTAALTIIHDDIDINLGQYKFSSDSRAAGHRGVQSIINTLKTKNFNRLRLGIRTDTLEKIPAEKFVLQKFSPEELKIIQSLIGKIIKIK